MMAQQQQYLQYTSQPGRSSPGATVYIYPGVQQPDTMVSQPGAAGTAALKNQFDLRSSRAVYVLAIIQFIVGFCIFTFHTASKLMALMFDRPCAPVYVGTGIWCGILFLVTGTFGFVARKKNSTALITTFLVMNVISSVVVLIMLALDIMSVIRIEECQEEDTSIYVNIPDAVWIAMDDVMITFAAIEFIVAVTSAVYSYKAVCNRCGSCQLGSGVHVATTVQLPSQQQQQQPQQLLLQHTLEETPAQYPAAGAATMNSYGQPSYAQPKQPPYYQQQQVPLLAANSQIACGPYAGLSDTAIRDAAPSGVGYTGHAYYPPAAGDSNAVHSAPELPPSYDAAVKL